MVMLFKKILSLLVLFLVALACAEQGTKIELGRDSEALQRQSEASSVKSEAASMPPGQKADFKETKVTKGFPGRILFDSNRGGTFGIYTIYPDGTRLTKVLDDPDVHEMFPDPSPCGRRIVFARSKHMRTDLSSEIWIMNSDGSYPRIVNTDGTFPTFSADGKTIYFERRNRGLFKMNVDGSDVVGIFPGGYEEFKDYYVVKPRMSPDGSRVTFMSNKDGYWNAYYYDFGTQEYGHIGQGCEPISYDTDENKILWVGRHTMETGSGFGVYDVVTESWEKVHDEGPPWGHEYFPDLVAGDSFLIFSSCPHDQHSHFDANYQLFIKNMENGETARVTFDSHTNRWPKLLPNIPARYRKNARQSKNATS